MIRTDKAPCVGDYTLYQLKVLYEESLKHDSERSKNLSNIIRYSDVQALEAKDYKQFNESL